MSLYYSILKPKKIVNTIIDTLNIQTFEYYEFCQEHSYFISKEEYDPKNNRVHPLYYMAVLCDYKNDPKIRSDRARNFSIKKFCVALELYNLCYGIRNKRREIHFELSNDFYYGSNDHLIYIASLHYSENIRCYLEKYIVGLTIDYLDLCRLEDLLVKYIKECFFNRYYPAYEGFLKFGEKLCSTQYFSYEERYYDHFKELSEALNEINN